MTTAESMLPPDVRAAGVRRLVRRCGHRRRAAAAVAAGLLVACTPALNWREVLLGDSGTLALFPCKPDVLTRRVVIGGSPVEMTLHACSAAGSTFGVSHAVLADPAAAAYALAELAKVAAANIGDTTAVPATAAAHIRGLPADAHAFSLRLSAAGASGASATAGGTGGSRLQERAVWFAADATVFQASVVSGTLDDDAADTFFEGLQIPH